MNVLDLFSGIGGFSLGLERAGFKTVAFCEIDPFCRRVLAKHWPRIPCYDDIRTLTADRLAADGIAADVICGGFPCQDISTAGKGAGIAGERSGLWKDYRRLIGELRPRYVVVENVSALLNNGMDIVLGDLAALGYDAEWHCIPASAVGALHRRDRVWIVAHSHGTGQQSSCWDGRGSEPSQARDHTRRGGSHVADSISERGRGGDDQRQDAIYAYSCGEAIRSGEYGGWWATEPDVGRVAHGISARAHRLRTLGNAVVPQIPEIIGRAIMRASEVSSQDRGIT